MALTHPTVPSISSAWCDPFPGDSIACSCGRSGEPHAPLAELLSITRKNGSGRCPWHLGILNESCDAQIAEAACLVADSTMRWRCRGALGDYRLWREAVNSGNALSGRDKEKVLPFVQTLFGDRQNPKPEEHSRGWVAQFIWFRLAAEMHTHPERVLLSLEGPNFHATEPGGDGLAIWRRTQDNVLTFCLWEIKSHVGVAPMSNAVSRAYKQLDARATEYLAKFTAIQTVARDDPQIDDLCANLVDLWINNSFQSGAGVGVATHAPLAPSRCFSTMHKHFPALSSPGQLEGVVAAIADFGVFTRNVRERIWIAL